MNCPICHAEMVMDYKIKIENSLLFNVVTIKKGSDQRKVMAACALYFGRIGSAAPERNGGGSCSD